MVAVLASSCTTQKLWDATDPDAQVLVPASQVSEAELRDSGAPYKVDARGNYHVGKTAGQRVGDHALRFMLTPATVVVDVAPVAALVSAQLFLSGLALKSDGEPLLLTFPTVDAWESGKSSHFPR
jgi:hypothetical protein